MINAKQCSGVLTAFALVTSSCTGNVTRGSDEDDGDPIDDPAASTEDLGSTEFPARLLEPYTGPAVTDYDNTFLTYEQIKNRVKSVFNDDWVRNGANRWEANRSLLGGVDFSTKFVENRVATADFLFGVEMMSKEVCTVAVNEQKGPFTGIDTGTGSAAPGATRDATIRTLYKKMLSRSATDAEVQAAGALVTEIDDLPNNDPASGWSGLCEALTRHPDFLFAKSPSYSTATGEDEQALLLNKVAFDLIGRPASEAEMAKVKTGSIDALVDDYLASNEFRDYFYFKMRMRMESDGKPLSDETARLWVHIAQNDKPFSELITANYTTAADFSKADRPPEHGATGILTMKGYILPRPSLPHYNYSARVSSDFLGVVFVITPELLEMRTNGSTASSTVQEGSTCYSCHRLLTPLALQRQKWDDEGNYRVTSDSGAAIDDSDQGKVSWYPFKGAGMEAFAAQASKTEAFQRTITNAAYLLLVGRPMRAEEDERVIYKSLWDTNQASGHRMKALLKAIISSNAYRAK